MTTGHDDRVRGFPAFSPQKGRGRGRSWWARAWTTAMEENSLDREPLAKGRAHARTGHVGTITVSPGRIAAPVYGPGHASLHHTAVFVEELSDAEWARLLDQVAAESGHIAALLEGEMPHALVDAAEEAGVRLLPGIGDLEPECDCDDWELPCMHAAALCYQAAWLLDDDPFVLLLMRGRGRSELLDELRHHAAPGRSAARGREATAARGTSAEEAYARVLGPLPEETPPPGTLDALPALTPLPGGEPDALDLLVADAAARARDLLVTGAPPPRLDLWRDTVRLAAAYHGRARERLGRASGRGEELERAARAWEYGGPQGLEVLESPWDPPEHVSARMGDALSMTWEGERAPRADVRHNHWTLVEHGIQVRYGRDGRWYPYHERDGLWWPAGPPSHDPAEALAGLLDG
ncbi:SWIM zinc finger family protein [Marinactinospora thermotolerans]|uniref:Uncharacterized conserved protein, contains Zn finger domain n=1 Tax=Marinactinospora thermotolerans DSM 45154 TaxID=1122192 RepID=A0A1T4PNU3_9ACTN|nr:hypothetical protein [Marinactinospora thermotolerans]SJZ93250.1 Uncharacterized conserved protein, contains Zn finger domain [Marinactinospora thermotolerans DSM 45154]